MRRWAERAAAIMTGAFLCITCCLGAAREMEVWTGTAQIEQTAAKGGQALTGERTAVKSEQAVSGAWTLKSGQALTGTGTLAVEGGQVLTGERTAAKSDQALTGERTAVKGERAAERTVEAPRVALTFDDGPSKYTKQLSSGLCERGVAATFFLLGVNIEGREAEVRQLAEDGHLLGNHSYHHVQLDQLSEQKACQEIVKTNNRIYEITGCYPTYVRPPYGEWDKELDCGVDMIPIFWTVDSLDWKLKNTERIVKNVLDQVKDGDIILMHDGYETSVEAAFQIVDTLKEQGFQFVTAEKMIEE